MSLTERVDKAMLLSWVIAFLLAVCLVYAVFYVASSLGLQFFVLSNRGMVLQTVSGNLLSGSLDVLVWGGCLFGVLALACYKLGSCLVRGPFALFLGVGLFGVLSGLVVWVFLVVFGLVALASLVWVSGLLLGFCFVFAHGLFGSGRVRLLLGVLFSGLLLVFFVELASFVLFNIPVALGLDAGVLGLHWNGVSLAFGNLAYPFLPFVYLLFFLFGLGAFVFRAFSGVCFWLLIKLGVRRFVYRVNGFFEVESGLGFRFGFLRSRLVVVLAVVVSGVVSFLFALFTVLPWSNPTGMLVSVDAPVYYKWIIDMQNVDVASALSLALSNDRAVLLVLFYVLSFVVSPVLVVQFAPALLLALLAVVSVLVLRMLTCSRLVWVLGALLVPFSFHSLGLFPSGYFANLLAIILVFVYIVLFFRLVDKWSSLGFFALLGVSVLVLFSHSWTWFAFALSLGMFVLLEWRLAVTNKSLWSRFKDKAVLVVVTLAVGFAIDVLRNVLFPVSSSVSALSTAQSSLGFPNFGFLVSGIKDAVAFVSFGAFSNQLLIVLCFIGFLVLLRFKSGVANFLVAWVFVTFVYVIFAADALIFDRALFMLPWFVLSGLGLAFVARFVGSRFGAVGCVEGWRLRVVFVVLGFVFLVLFNICLRFLFNLSVW